MKNVASQQPQHQALTIGELCQAIAEGQIAASVDNKQCYRVSARDMRRLVRSLQQQASAPAEEQPGHLASV